MADSDQSINTLRYNQVSGSLEGFGGGSPQWTPLTLTNTDPTQVPITRLINTTAPLTGGGNLSADRTLSMPAATNSVNGYLTSADHTTFAAALPAASFTDAAVTGKLLTGYSSGAGTVAATDTILQAFQKINGNTALKATAGAIGSSGLTQNTARLLGRTTASAGAIEEIIVGTGLSLSAGTLTATGGSSPTPSVQVLTVATTSTTSATYVTTDLTHAFALSNASHKVRITISGQLEMTGNLNVGYATVKMDSTDLDTTGNGFIQVFPEGAATDWFLNGGFNILASPGDTASHTYALFIRNDSVAGANNCHWNNFPGTSTMILEEVV